MQNLKLTNFQSEPDIRKIILEILLPLKKNYDLTWEPRESLSESENEVLTRMLQNIKLRQVIELNTHLYGSCFLSVNTQTEQFFNHNNIQDTLIKVDNDEKIIYINLPKNLPRGWFHSDLGLHIYRKLLQNGNVVPAIEPYSIKKNYITYFDDLRISAESHYPYKHSWDYCSCNQVQRRGGLITKLNKEFELFIQLAKISAMEDIICPKQK
jgi:hypothetical protein